MGSRKRNIPHGRPKRKRARAKRYLVVTNGEVTEKQYFEYLNSDNGIAIMPRTKKLVPENLALLAKSLWEEDQKESFASAKEGKSEPYEHVFVVTDVDEYTASQFKEADKICKHKSFDLIISNPCFEVWLIDHVEVCPASIHMTEDANKRAHSLGLTKGSDNKEIEIKAVDGLHDKAIKNAYVHMNDARQRIKRENLDKLDFAPWTDMPKVIEILKQK